MFAWRQGTASAAQGPVDDAVICRACGEPADGRGHRADLGHRNQDRFPEERRRSGRKSHADYRDRGRLILWMDSAQPLVNESSPAQGK